jgi:3-methyladenine DNA glycosylase AlkD
MGATERTSAGAFVERLGELARPVDQGKAQAWFRTDRQFLGARVGDVFKLAQEFVAMPLDDVAVLLESTVHEARVGAVSILGKQVKARRATDETKRAVYECYLANRDRIDTWDLVDVSAHHVIGGYLIPRDRDVLYELARSPQWFVRRMSIYSTLAFLRTGDVDDTFALAELLVGDDHDLVQKPVGGLLREAGKHDRARLLDFLDQHAASAPAVLVRFATERLSEDERRRYAKRGGRPSPS